MRVRLGSWWSRYVYTKQDAAINAKTLYIEMWVQMGMQQTMQVLKNEVSCSQFWKCNGLCETWNYILKKDIIKDILISNRTEKEEYSCSFADIVL